MNPETKQLEDFEGLGEAVSFEKLPPLPPPIQIGVQEFVKPKEPLTPYVRFKYPSPVGTAELFLPWLPNKKLKQYLQEGGLISKRLFCRMMNEHRLPLRMMYVPKNKETIVLTRAPKGGAV